MNLTWPLLIRIFQISTIPCSTAVPEIILMVLNPRKCDPAPTQQKNHINIHINDFFWLNLHNRSS